MDVARELATALRGRYEVERELGRGGMAIVFLARDVKHDRRVAVKVLRPDLSATIGVERFLREIQIGAQLQHPHIVPLFDSGDANGLPYYAMAYVEGESLRDRLERDKQLPLDEALQLTREVADALGYAHSRGVVHRDVKPENILLAGGHALVADFGIARALSAAAADATATGLAIGTPTYMSPEQAGGAEVDGRSDLYSLGCVLFEMLVGEPPFTGPTASAVLARHMQESLPSVRIVRPTVPRGIEDVLGTLLAKTPADRFATAARLIEALARPTSVAAGSPMRRNRRLAVGVAIAAVLGAIGWSVLLRDGATPDPLAYVLLPFVHRDGAEPALLDGAQCQWRLSEALKGWDAVAVVDPIVVRDAARRLGDRAPSHDDWLAISGGLGFGTLVRGEVAEFHDTVYLVATAYRAPGGRVVGRGSVRFMAPTDDVRATFEQLAAQLLGVTPAGGPAMDVGTRSLAAGRAYAGGRAAIAEGDLESAEERFLEATQADPRFGDAQFWLAQVRAWRGRALEAWAAAAQRAVDVAAGLTDPHARALAPPLLDLARRRFPEACDRYREAVARDSADFVAWFGLGECQFRDATVLQDPASASGWRFRSSYDAASTAYRRGLAAAPFLSGAVSERLQRILITEPGRFRLGAALPPDTGGFWAYPSLAGDTLGFVPYRAAAVASGTVEDPPTLSAALAHGRLLLSEIARSWVEAYPRSAAALMAGAANYEELARSGGGALDVRRALELVRQARALDPPSLTRVVLAHMEARLLLKLEQFDEVQRLADSALRAVTDPDPRVARRLAALAMLLGRPHEAVRLLEAGAQFAEPVAGLRDVPLPMLIARERLMGYAAIGESGDSVRRLIGVLDSLVGAWSGDASDARRQAVLEEPLAAAFPSHGRGSAHRPDASSHVVRLQARLAAGDAAGVRAGLDTLEAVRRGLRAQDVSMGVYYQEAWLRLQVGDTATTVAVLDRMLSDFPALSTRTLADVVDVAALVRIMTLRAQLEPPGGAVGRRWAGAVATLWRGAEPELLPVVRAMRALAG